MKRRRTDKWYILYGSMWKIKRKEIYTGKSLSEALLFSEHGENMLCTKIVLNVRNFCTQQVCGWNFHVLNCNSMKNLLSYCGLIDAIIRASNKDLPVQLMFLLAFLKSPRLLI